MKKILLIMLMFLMPINAFAYSDYIYRGGKTIGIEVTSDGIMIVGFYEVNGKFNKGKLQNGDYIIKVENEAVTSVNELTKIIEKYADKKNIDITIKRNGKPRNEVLELQYIDGVYKTGLYVKDSITGIGTLTYVDPETNIYGALGHEIIDTNNNLVEIKSGNIFKNYITGIDKSAVGSAGSKTAKYEYNTVFGNITKNSVHGIFGKYNYDTSDLELVKVADDDEVKIGAAKIYTVLNQEKIQEYDITVTGINESSNVKNIVFEITDKELIDKTGGVVQGMSGSPIIQNDKIIGVVTHVIIDNPITGYGLFITKMLEEGEN